MQDALPVKNVRGGTLVSGWRPYLPQAVQAGANAFPSCSSGTFFFTVPSYYLFRPQSFLSGIWAYRSQPPSLPPIAMADYAAFDSDPLEPPEDGDAAASSAGKCQSRAGVSL